MRHSSRFAPLRSCVEVGVGVEECGVTETVRMLLQEGQKRSILMVGVWVDYFLDGYSSFLLFTLTPLIKYVSQSQLTQIS